MIWFSLKNGGVYSACALIGYLVYLAVRPSAWGPYVSILVTYHLYLIFLLLTSERKHSRSFALPITVAVHTGFPAVLVMARMLLISEFSNAILTEPADHPTQLTAMAALLIRLIPLLGGYGLSYLELYLLFGEKTALSPERATPAFAAPDPKLREGTRLLPATKADHNEWLEYYSKLNAFQALGKPPELEYEKWLRARGKTQYRVVAAEEGL
jgi:hypothetical protein